MRDTLHTRARRVRALASVRAWEYRQRNHSKGVWFRLRRVLADAESAFAIPCSAVERLEREGFRRESVGTEIEPQKVILFVPAARLEEIPEKLPPPGRPGCGLPCDALRRSQPLSLRRIRRAVIHEPVRRALPGK